MAKHIQLLKDKKKKNVKTGDTKTRISSSSKNKEISCKSYENVITSLLQLLFNATLIPEDNNSIINVTL